MSDPIRLDRRSLPDLPGASRRVTELIGLAASVMLDRRHGARDEDPARVMHHPAEIDAIIQRTLIDASDLLWLKDPLRTADFGGEAVGIVTAHRVLGRVVVQRLTTETGADYLVRRIDAGADAPLERLELSGIGDGGSSTSGRLQQKVRQLDKYPDGEPGFAIVTNFRTDPVEIAIEAYPS